MELSTTIPTPKAKPPKLKTLRDKPNSPIKMMAARVARGMAKTIMKVCRREPRNSKTAIAANPVPINPELVTLAMELRINCDSSKVGVRLFLGELHQIFVVLLIVFSHHQQH